MPRHNDPDERYDDYPPRHINDVDVDDDDRDTYDYCPVTNDEYDPAVEYHSTSGIYHYDYDGKQHYTYLYVEDV